MTSVEGFCYIGPIVKKRMLQFYAASGESINLIDDLIEVGYVDDGKILKAPDYLRGKLLK